MLDGLEMQEDRLWLDQADAIEQIEKRVALGQVPENRARKLRDFALNGFLSFELHDIDGLSEGIRSDVDRIWGSKPVDLAYVFVDQPSSMADSRERRERMAPTRIIDLHSHSAAALQLYLHRRIFDWAELIFGTEAVAFESSFGEFGWSEPPCRDAVYIEVQPPSHLLTVWIPLEDIRPESGPLYLIPGSHRLPLYEFEPGRFRIKPDEDYLTAHRFVLARAEEAGLTPIDLLPKRGQAVIWHPLMVHGARRILRPGATRRAMTVRLSARGGLPTRRASYWKTVRGSLWRKDRRLFWNETDRMLEREGCRGFDNPLRGMNPRGLTILEKFRSWFSSRPQ
jgi:hypothetical protein